MTEKCLICKKELQHWSKFKDLRQKEGVGIAICGSIINGLDHFWAGESRSNKQKPDYRTLDLLYCQYCKKYYIKCPGCNATNALNEMPNETKTIVVCSKCHKRILYADGDYSMGGG